VSAKTGAEIAKVDATTAATVENFNIRIVISFWLITCVICCFTI
jgi:hypothetical protein